MTDIRTTIATMLHRYESWRDRYFPERQLFLRSKGHVRFLTIHSYTQIAISAVGLVALGWGLVTSYAYLTRDSILEDKDKTITAMSSQYESLSNDFSILEAEIERRTRLLEERHQLLELLLEEAPRTVPALLPVAPVKRESSPLPGGITAAGGPFNADIPGDSTPESPSDSSSENDEELPEQQTNNIKPDDATGGAETNSDDTPKSEDRSLSFFDSFFGYHEDKAPVLTNSERRQALLARLGELDQAQHDLATRLIDTANARLTAIDGAIGRSGVTVAALTNGFDGPLNGTGGPFEPDTEYNLEGIFASDDGQTFSDLLNNYERLKMVTNALDSYPHGEPAAEFYLSSPYGRRLDPIKKVWSRHYAVDLAGWPGTAITATAPGKVVKAGWFGPYGNMVELDHGNGFKTRYGHMRKLNVKKNEEVTFGQKIGEMGKTGRVTDTHVHYEVWFNGKVLDPMPFMKAAENVLKIQGRYQQQGE